MQIERFYLGCLAHASYLVYDGGEAAIIDPQRDVDLYVEEARKRALTIRWVIETHLHADFVSGHLELARRTGATICLGAGSGATFQHRALADEEILQLGGARLRILATPGHTEESICIVALPNHPAEPPAVFTGDTLFIGDVGRPDLSPSRTPRELASLLYDSLHHKLLLLPDETLVYPAHGAGSLCGRQMSSESASSIGRERLSNYALLAPDRESFVDLLTRELPPRPAYFSNEVELNRSGADDLGSLAPIAALSPAQVLALQSAGAIVLDTRPVIHFAAAHVPGSIHIALGGQFASWAARILAGVDSGLAVRIILVAEDDEGVQECRLRLARVGLENLAGYLEEGIYGWIQQGNPIEFIPQISVEELHDWQQRDPATVAVLDVREPSERSAGFVPGSISIPLPELPKRVTEINPGVTVLVYCKGGYRSSIATSLLQRAKVFQVGNVTGGYDAWAPASRALLK